MLFDAKFNAHKKYKLKKYGMQNYIIYIYIYIYILVRDLFQANFIFNTLISIKCSRFGGGPETIPWLEFFAILVKGFQLLVVVMKSFVLHVPALLDPSMNLFLYFRFDISKGN